MYIDKLQMGEKQEECYCPHVVDKLLHSVLAPEQKMQSGLQHCIFQTLGEV